ncbi:MAG: hypothetical protein A3I68_01835 [Candidatus Melainabacteria bacterium RIFCSPLOWO2_02_FULL_35_15]|nr:MAG: hypothetical protein A3F80_09530 [Candidatus Melainabacteria bacterium RIFCSPLOWO2_12_FULL_35_11]OGI14295.1 MAG: hypothetical protein A3I68_01835 [Candidatus Melainabacteria bacterium RIFCSPLOWO2_02_FULL_35_15]
MKVKNFTEAINMAVLKLYPIARQKAINKVTALQLPITQDRHALNVKTDCAIRAVLAAKHYYPKGLTQKDDVRTLLISMYRELISNPNWDKDRCAATIRPYSTPHIPFSEAHYANEMQTYHLLLAAAFEAITEYIESGGKLPEIEESTPLADEPSIIVLE